MADQPEKYEKTEPASHKRLEDARERGQVAFSSEVMVAATLLAGGAALLIGGPSLATAAGSLVVQSGSLMAAYGSKTLAVPDYAALLGGAARSVLPGFLGLVLPVFAVAGLVGYAQTGGFRVAPKAVTFDPGKIDPIKGLKRIFSMRAVIRAGLSATKITVILVAVVAVAWNDLLRVGRMAGDDLGPVLVAVGRLLLRAGIVGVLVVIALSVFDLWFQRRQFARDQMMTKKEVRDEHKSTEGDPLVKSRIRALQREVASRRMMADVPDATVVVTNPTHFAVALRYQAEHGDAPRVVAKGVDALAERIRAVAGEAGVLLYEDPPLARALHRQCEIGDEIPEDLFQAVAGVLAFVYRVQGTPVTV